MKRTSNKKHLGYNKRKTALDYIIFVFLFIYALLIVYPFYNALLISISSESSYLETPFMLFPKEINWDSYLQIFTDKSLWTGYAVTIFVTVVGTAFQLFFTTITGYALSRKGWLGQNLVMSFILITMFVNGGLIPYYYLIKGLGLYNSIWVMIIPGAISTYNMLLIRNYFQSLPKELEESAKIDGANDIQVFIRVYLPLAVPMVATITLFLAVGNWNQWYNAMLFIDDQSLKPLQLVLRELIVTNTSSFSPNPNGTPMFSEGMKMACIFFSTVPIMFVYPFVQKFFVKGLVVGALKG
jgi:putative aldouronate transport system permease protein